MNKKKKKAKSVEGILISSILVRLYEKYEREEKGEQKQMGETWNYERDEEGNE